MAQKTRSLDGAKRSFLHTIENENTAISHQATLERLAQYVAQNSYPAHDMRLIDADLLAEFFKNLRETPYSKTKDGKPKYRRPATMLSEWSSLSAFWQWLIKRGFADENALDGLPRPKHNKEPINPLSAEEFTKILQACTYTRAWHGRPLTRTERVTAVRDRALICVLMEGMLRSSEAINLRMVDVIPKRTHAILRVDLGKGSKSRVVHVGRRVAGYLNEYILDHRQETSDQAPFFTSVLRNSGLKMTRQALGKIVGNAGERAGVKCWPHRLRATGACLRLLNGESLPEVSRAMGHSDISQTMRYVEAMRLNYELRIKQTSPIDNLRL